MAKPRKHSVALAIASPEEPGRLLLVLRPLDDDELPGVWGLPAGSLRPDETAQDTVLRVGRQKLGVALHAPILLAVGEQERDAYALTMSVFRVMMKGEPALPPHGRDPGLTYYAAWRWSDPSALEEGALRGSLCCQLYLQHRQAGLR